LSFGLGKNKLVEFGIVKPYILKHFDISQEVIYADFKWDTILDLVKHNKMYQGKNLPKGKKSYAVSFTLQDENKTLTDKQIDKIMSKLQNNFEKQLGAEH